MPIGAHAPEPLVQIDRDTYVIGDNANTLAYTWSPIGVAQIEQSMLFGKRLHGDVRPVEQCAKARSVGASNVLP